MKILKAFGYDVVWMKYFRDASDTSEPSWQTLVLDTLTYLIEDHGSDALDSNHVIRCLWIDNEYHEKVCSLLGEHARSEIDRGAAYVCLVDGKFEDPKIVYIIAKDAGLVVVRDWHCSREEHYSHMKRKMERLCNPSMYSNFQVLKAAANAKSDIPNDRPNGWIQSTYKWLMTKIEPETLQKYGAEYGLIEEE